MPLPDRWLQYSAVGKVIEGTRIICFKVPLKTTMLTNNPEVKEIWDVKTLLQTIPNIGLVIDLTNTKKYYDPYLVKSAGVHHLKLLMPGRILPPKDIVAQFMNAVDEFLQDDKERLVGVHCTHGLNRTGYMVCHYMRDRMGIPAAEAIKRFEEARGHKMERNVYINDLMQITNWRTQRDVELNEENTPEVSSSPCDQMKERRDSATRNHRWSPCDERKETRDRSSNNKQNETEDRNGRDRDRSPHERHRETDQRRRSPYSRHKGGIRDSRRSLFEQEKKERNSRRSPCYEIDYSFDY